MIKFKVSKREVRNGFKWNPLLTIKIIKAM